MEQPLSRMPDRYVGGLSREVIIDFNTAGENAIFGPAKPLLVRSDAMIRSFSGEGSDPVPDVSSGKIVKVDDIPSLRGLCAQGRAGIAVTPRIPCSSVRMTLQCVGEHAVYIWMAEHSEPVVVPHAAGVYAFESPATARSIVNVAIHKKPGSWTGTMKVTIGPVTLVYD